jgi:hypothetical protein
VHVRRVDTTGLKEAYSGADTKASKNWKGTDVLVEKLVRLLSFEWVIRLTAATAVPPGVLFLAGLVKVKTVALRRASPVRSSASFDGPVVRSLWKRLIAVGAVRRSSKMSGVEDGAAGAAELALATISCLAPRR